MGNIVISNDLRDLVDGMIIIIKNSESSLGKLDLGIPIEVERRWFVTSLVHSTIEKLLTAKDRRTADMTAYSYLKDLSIDCTEEELVNTEEDFPPVDHLDRNLKILRGVMIRYIYENMEWTEVDAMEVATTSGKVIPFVRRDKR